MRMYVYYSACLFLYGVLYCIILNDLFTLLQTGKSCVK